MKRLIPISIQVFDGNDHYQIAMFRETETISDKEFNQRFPDGANQPITVLAVGRGLDSWYLVQDVGDNP